MKPLADKLELRFASLSALFTGCLGVAIYFNSWFPLLVPVAALLFYGGLQERKWLFFLLIFSLPFSFEFHVDSSLSTDIPDEGLMAIVMLVFGAAWLFSPALVTRKTINHPLLLLLCLYFTWTITCSIFSSHPLLSLKYLLAKSWYLGAFVLAALVIFSDKKNIARTGSTLFFVLAGMVIIILAHHALLGFRFSTINNALFPFFRNHVNYGAMLVCILPIGFALHRLSSKKWRPYLTVLLLLLFTALYFSYSRGAWLALVAGIVTLFLIQWRKFFAAYLLLILLTTAAFFWLRSGDRYLQFAPDFKTTIFHSDFSEHWVATYKLKDVSTAERFYRWVAGVRMVADKPVLGFGPNSFYDEYKPYAIPAFRTWVSNNPDHSTVHNYFLLTAIEQGLPGLFLLLVLIGAMVWYAERIYHRSTDKQSRLIALALGMIISMLLVLNFLSDLIETDKIGSIFFLCIAALVALDHQSSKPSPHVESISQSISE